MIPFLKYVNYVRFVSQSTCTSQNKIEEIALVLTNQCLFMCTHKSMRFIVNETSGAHTYRSLKWYRFWRFRHLILTIISIQLNRIGHPVNIPSFKEPSLGYGWKSPSRVHNQIKVSVSMANRLLQAHISVCE